MAEFNEMNMYQYSYLPSADDDRTAQAIIDRGRYFV